MFRAAVDTDGVQRSTKSRDMKDVPKTKCFTINATDDSATTRTRNRDVVGQQNVATRSRGVLNEGNFVREHMR